MSTRARRHALGKSYSDVICGFRGRSRTPRTSSPVPATRPTSSACWSGARPSASPRSHTAAAPRSSAASRRLPCGGALQRRRLDRSERARSGARGRSRLARGAHPGGCDRSRAGGSARGARLDFAPLPAVVRALNARGLDRHARGRPLRDGPDPHRGLRRVHPRDHAGGSVGVAPAARLGRGRQPRSDARRLGGRSRRDHPGMGPRSAATRRTGASAGMRFERFFDGAECVRATQPVGP